VEEPRAGEQLAEDLMFFHAAAEDPRPLEVRVFPESLADLRDMREAFTASSDRFDRAVKTPVHAVARRF